MKNADWLINGPTQKVFSQNSSLLTEEEANLKITDGNPGSQKGSGRVYRNVNVRMLKIDWIFHVDKNGKSRGFGDMVQALAKAPHESLFSTDLITTLVDNFWGKYSTSIIVFCLGPFMLYSIACAIYFTGHVSDAKH